MKGIFVKIAVIFVVVCAMFVDAEAQEIRVTDGKGTLQLVTVNRVFSSAVIPVGSVEGDVWFDTTTNTTKVFDGTSWDDLDPDSVTESPSAPSIPKEGDIWFDTTNSLIKVWDGNTWKNIASTDPDDLRDDQNLSVTTDSLLIEDGTGVKLSDLGTDNQKIDTLALQGDTLLQISLEGDDESAKTLDLSSLSTKEPWFGTDDDAIATENTEDIYHMGNIALGTDSATERLDVDGKLRLRNRLDKTDADTTVMILVADSNGVIDEIERYWITQASRTPSTSNIFSSSMTATQPSTYQLFMADKAINGNTASNDRALTNGQVYPWWKIDVGTDTTINRLRFFQYGSSHARLSNFYIVFSTSDISLPTTPTASDLTSLLSANDNVHYSGQIPYQSGDVIFSEKTFRYMIIVRDISVPDYLQIAEVQAFNDDILLSDIGTMKKKVGIGTVSPAATLHVEGDARITTVPDGTATDSVLVRNTAGDVLKVAASSLANDWKLDGNSGTTAGTNFLGTTDAQDLVFKTNNTEAVRFKSGESRLLFANPGDFVFPGMSSSAVLGIDGFTHSRLRLTAGDDETFDDSKGASIDLHGNTSSSSSGVLDLVAGQAAGDTTGAINFWTNTTGAVGGQQRSATLTGAGNFGIGTGSLSPAKKLHVAGDARIETVPDGAVTDSVLVRNTDGDILKINAADLGAANEPWFGTDDKAGATDNTEDIYLMGNMAVGQDSVSPGKVATFNGDVDIKGVLDPTKLIFSGDGTVGSFDPTTDNQYEIEFQEGRDLEIKSNTTDNIIHVQNDGYVGIGTASPSATLTVAAMAPIPTGAAQEIVSNFESFSSSNFAFINSTQTHSSSSDLFNDAVEGSAFHAKRVADGQDWGIGYSFSSSYFITEVRLQSRSDCCPGRTGGGVIQVLKSGAVVATSAVIPDPAATSQWSAYSPNVEGDEVRYVFLKGVNSNYGDDYFNASEFEITGRQMISPASLMVEGTTRISNLPAATLSSDVSVLVTDTKGFLQSSSVADIAKEPWFGVDDDKGATDNTEDIYHMGNIGIGVDSATQRLDVNGTGIFRNGGAYNNYTKNQITFSYNGTDEYRNAIRSRHHAFDKLYNAIDFYTWNAGVNAKEDNPSLHGMTVVGGRVGIGEPVPSTFLHIRNTDTTNASMINNISSILRLHRLGLSGNKYSQNVDFAIGSFDSVKPARTRLDIRLGYGNTNFVDKTPMTIRADGRVGINERKIPEYNLDVNGTFRNSEHGKFVVMNGSDDLSKKDRGIYLWRETDVNWGIYLSRAGAGRSLSGDTAVAGGGFNSYAVRFRTGAANTYGFIFENHNEDLLLSLRGGDGLIRNKYLKDQYNNQTNGAVVVTNANGDITGSSYHFVHFAKTWMGMTTEYDIATVRDAFELRGKVYASGCSGAGASTFLIEYWSDTGFNLAKSVGRSWSSGGSGTTADPYWIRVNNLSACLGAMEFRVIGGVLKARKTNGSSNVGVHLDRLLVTRW